VFAAESLLFLVAAVLGAGAIVDSKIRSAPDFVRPMPEAAKVEPAI
jgi:hypothetical protein